MLNLFTFQGKIVVVRFVKASGNISNMCLIFSGTTLYSHNKEDMYILMILNFRALR